MSEEEIKKRETFYYKGKFWLSLATKASVDALESFEIRDDDVLITSFPKSGTHWMFEIVQLYLANGNPTKICRNLHVKPLEFADYNHIDDCIGCEDRTPICKIMKHRPSPRQLITHGYPYHLPRQVLEKETPIIYVARNPWDVAVSYFEFIGRTQIFNCDTFNEFLLEVFVPGLAHGSWFEHVQKYWDLRHKSHVLYVTYEEMQTNTHDVVVKVGEFLDRKVDDDLVSSIVKNVAFDQMKKNTVSRSTGLGSYCNKGKSRWKTTFSVANDEYLRGIYDEKMKNYEELTKRLVM